MSANCNLIGLTKPDSPALRIPTEDHGNVVVPNGKAAYRVERGIFELRHGHEVVINHNGKTLHVVAIEHLDNPTLTRLRSGSMQILISAQRASVLGHSIDSDAADVCVPATTTAAQLRTLAGVIDPTEPYPGPFECNATDSRLASAALELARQGGRVPALCVRHDTQTVDTGISVQDIEVYRTLRGQLLERASQAKVQIPQASNTEFVVYRERFGDAQHVAVIVGNPDLTQPVTVRLHSACFTGDLFSSLRCDCGEQLSSAVEHMSRDGGVILYLDQEGRGIGLANKMRAYRMQADGYDTIDADRHLGFGADGRDFTAARTMLTDLGISHVRLLTNNPAKIAALDTGGINVVERVPLPGSVNQHNARYLETKRDRGGHLASVTEGTRKDE